jgi:hypothetical protein
LSLDKVCLILRAGINANGVAQLDLQAQDGTFQRTWFYSGTDNAREILAVALAAITSEKLVEANVDDPATNNFGVQSLWVIA